MKKLNKQKNNGITLIALVITIIVLLILAAVSIATLTGENGILSQATKAGDRTTQETEKEELKLSYNAAKSKKYEEGDYTGEITAKDLEDELKKQNPNAKVKENSSPIEVTFPSGNVYTVDGKTGEIIGPKSNTEENRREITFTICFRTTDDGGDTFNSTSKEYTALEGMTWYEWVNSEYNTFEIELKCEEKDDAVYWIFGDVIGNDENGMVYGNHLIEEGKTYTVQQEVW